MKARIGIDVGGTFTDAALIDNDTYELIDTVKVLTTHSSKFGVAEGIIKVLSEITKRNNIEPEDVLFIAHGTTQATNALLEGDVVPVGIVSIGTGIQGLKSKSDTSIGDIPLTSMKSIHTLNEYVDSSSKNFEKDIEKAIETLRNGNVKSIVAAEAFSVDNTENENRVVDTCNLKEIPATATNVVSKLYGLKVRTRTAVVNASIMPKMMETANLTEDSIKKAGIKTPLMVMRCDGGVMTVDEVRKRPILTILSGPAAGVAGALMYERLTDGIFLEVGGTSTDISCVKNGKVQVKYAIVGGHKTYLTSLDVRTVGIGGGSMIQINNEKMSEVGPRSAHIAGLDYEVYSKPEDIIEPKLKYIRPLDGDSDYACVECANGKTYALTLSGAANIAGYVGDDDYAKGNLEASRRAWKPLADKLGLTIEETAEKCLDLSAEKNSAIVKQLMEDYNMDPRTTTLVGGGGGASTVVPHLGKTLKLNSKNAKNSHVISTIGVALAMVRDMIERTIPNPTEKDILAIRREAEEKVIAAGANPETVEITIDVDTTKHLVRATAIGTTELRTKDIKKKAITVEEIMEIVANNLNVKKEDVYIAGESKNMYVMQAEVSSKKLFGIINKRNKATRVVDKEGIIRLQKIDGHVKQCLGMDWMKWLPIIVDKYTDYTDGNKGLPNVYVIFGKKIIDLSGLDSVDKIVALAKVELQSVKEDDKLVLLCSKRTD